MLTCLEGQRGRVIDRLRRLVPGRWTYDARTHQWLHENGMIVRACAQMSPRYEGDDETYRTVYVDANFQYVPI